MMALIDVQSEPSSMWSFRQMLSPKENWVRKMSSPTQSEDSGIGWSPSPCDAGDVKLDLENPALRHQAVNKGGEFTEVTTISYNQERALALNSRTTNNRRCLNESPVLENSISMRFQDANFSGANSTTPVQQRSINFFSNSPKREAAILSRSLPSRYRECELIRFIYSLKRW